MPDALRDRFALNDKPADEYLPWHGHASDRIVLLADGSHVASIRLDGRSLSLMDEDQRYAERRRRHAVLRTLTDSNVALYEHHVCHDRVPPFPLGRFRSAYARSLAEDYHTGIAQGMRAREWYVTLVVRPKPVAKLINKFRRGDPEQDPELIGV